VENTVVGIKTAGGEFFPILDPSAGKKRRVVLEPSHKGQKTVKIELYVRDVGEPDGLGFLGAIFFEDVAADGSGESEIELVLGADTERNIYATATDLVSGERKSISVAARPEDRDDEFSIPDSPEDERSGVVLRTETDRDRITPEAYADSPAASGQEQRKTAPDKPVRKGVRPLLLTVIVVLGLSVILLAAWFILRETQPRETTRLESVSVAAGAPAVPSALEVPPLTGDRPA
jgi:hypothetical protein